MHYWGYYGWGYGMGFLMIVFWVLVIICIVYLIRHLGRGPSGYVPHETPLDVLKRRYANGDITREEYQRMKEDLRE